MTFLPAVRAVAAAGARCWDGCSGFAGRHRALAWCAAACVACVTLAGVVPVALVTGHVYRDHSNLPDLGPFERFEFPTIGHVYDANGQPLIQLAREYRSLTPYDDIPPVVRDAILAAEDKRFFAHDGVDYATVPRVLLRIRTLTLIARLLGIGPADQANAPAIFPQGGSTITQQLVTRSFPQRVDVAGKQRPAPGTRPAAPFALVRAGRAKCEHDCPQGGGDAALRLDRT